MKTINLAEKLALFDDPWTPKIVAALNGQHVKLVKARGAFVWHHHENEDELFFVLNGRLTIQLAERAVTLEAGEMMVVARGVEHRPIADPEAHLLLFEPASTVNTGSAGGDRTVDSPEWI